MTLGQHRRLGAGQSCRVRVWDIGSHSAQTVYESTSMLLEAPNWTPDDRLIVNGEGALWSLPLAKDVTISAVETPGLPEVNNDHVLSPDGETIYASTNTGVIWAVPTRGGAAFRVTSPSRGKQYLHGVSPDGTHLAYVHLLPSSADQGAPSATIHTIGVDGSAPTQVTADAGPADGCEWTPDGKWIVFNTERFSTTAGHAQLARIRPDGADLEQLTFDDRVNWFPHVAPDGATAVYLSYAPGTTGHPADRKVQLRLVSTDDWSHPDTLQNLHGGQGTINVPSWAPDGRAFAFVDYPTHN
jgi:Tol biopolymer transport system component